MRLIALLIAMTLSQALAAARAQNVSIKATPASLEEIFNNLHRQTGYNFIYNSSMLESATPVTINVKNRPLREVLDECFSNQSALTYVIEDETVVVTIKEDIAPVIVTGTVVDEQNSPMPGVTIKVKDSDKGTITDNNGNFKIELETGNETLIFSFIGFEVMEVPVNGQSTLSISLTPSIASLDEIVVIGYGTVKKKDVTGAVSSVKSSDIVVSPVSNPMEALQGRVAGLDIQRTDGRAGAAPSVLLRGNRSLTAAQDPLYIIDGVMGNITSLNPNDIESIDVLKDAATTSIYGSAGANGVIIITTKKAKSGKVDIDIDSYYGINGFASYPKALSKDAWLQYMNDRYFATNGIAPNDITDLNLPASVKNALDSGKWVDWVDETLQTGVQQNHHISIRGGSEKVQAYFSLAYIGEKGVYKGDNAEFYNGRGGADVTFNKFLKAGLQTTINLKDNDQTNSRINKAFSTYPLGNPYTSTGEVNLYPLNDGSTVSPIANYASGVFMNNTKSLYIAANPYFEITPITNLSIRSNLGITLSASRQGTFESERSYNSATTSLNTKSASYSTDESYGYVWETIVNYSKDIQDHSFAITGVATLLSSTQEKSSISGQGLDFNDFVYYNLGAATTITGKSTSYIAKAKRAYTTRLNYSYKDKYLVILSNRYDGASQLVDKWSAFPSVSLGWRLSEESFMDNTRSWLDNMKLRLSYGVTGNANIDAYVSNTVVASRTSDFNLSLGGSSALPIYVLKQSLGNPDLTWEKSYGTNLGLDMTVLQGRVDLVAEFYHTDTKGVLYPRTLPSTNGGYDAKTPYTRVSNIAASQNDGIELTLNTRNIVNDDFQWRSAVTFTAAKEKLKSINLGNSVSADALVSANLFVGHPIKTIYGYKKIGIWQLGEEQEAALYGAKPGDIKLKTVPRTDATTGESDGGVHAYSPKDQQIIGHSNPNWTLGFQNAFTYRNFDFTVFMTMRYGQTINAQLLGYYNTIAQPETYNYWTPTNPTNDFPQPYQGTTINTTYASSLSVVDGSFMKIKNLTLGYTIPQSIGSKYSISRLRFYATAYNPLIFAKSKYLKDVDPETGGTDSFPLYKQIIFGVNLSF